MKINYPRLFELVRDGELEPLIETVQEYKQLGLPYDPHHIDKHKRNIMHWACNSAHCKIVQFLLKLEKWNLEARDALGYTALELCILSV
jgi:ankyrin repeat protein